jgi:hypothetical protein
MFFYQVLKFCLCRGVFEVNGSGMSPDLYNGIQAHLSSCASPKVLDVVDKFLPEISLHIALYFFAKDIERQEYEYSSF